MLIYLHGLNSSPLSYKAGLLRRHFPSLSVYAPAYPAYQPDTAIERLSNFFDGLPKEPLPLVVGSSMGGFYGRYLAQRHRLAHLFLINPALEPWNLLAGHLGETMTTAGGEVYRITPELIEQTRRYGVTDPGDWAPTTLFLDRGDEVIDYRIAESRYQGHGRLVVFDGGDHGFQHMSEVIETIRQHLEEAPGTDAEAHRGTTP